MKSVVLAVFLAVLASAEVQAQKKVEAVVGADASGVPTQKRSASERKRYRGHQGPPPLILGIGY